MVIVLVKEATLVVVMDDLDFGIRDVVTKKEGSNNNTTPLSNSLRQNVVGYLSIKPAA
jgi:hypothetical protein